MMEWRCRTCGAIASAEILEKEALMFQFYKVKDELPHVISIRCLSYISLFRPAPRRLLWAKALRLIGELQGEISKPYIQWEGKPARPNSPAAWAQAMERITERPPKSLPLKSHGYLRSIAYEIADEMDRSVEVRQNKAERSGHFQQQGAVEHRDAPRQPTPEDFARMRKMIKGVGKEL